MRRFVVLGGLGPILMAWLAQPGLAEVTEADEHGFVSVHELHVKASPARVFEALFDEVGHWWDPAHTYSGNAANLSFGCLAAIPALCEEPEDVVLFVRHMTIDFLQPPRTLRLSGGLGPLQAIGATGSMTFDLEEAETGTRLSYRYTVNGRNTASWATPVDRVQLGQLERLRRYVETGSPVPDSRE